jgi:hypothetical protein
MEEVPSVGLKERFLEYLQKWVKLDDELITVFLDARFFFFRLSSPFSSV